MTPPSSALRAAGSATTSRRAWPATLCSRRAACSASPRAGRARGSTTWSSSAAATSSGAARTRWPRAGAPARRSRSRPLGEADGARRWPPTTSSGRGAGGRRAGSVSRCAPSRWSRAATADGRAAARGRDVLAGSPARLEHARALADLGAALRRANRRAEARGALRGRARARRALRRARARRARAHRAARRRGPLERPGRRRRRAADRLRAPRRRAGRRGAAATPRSRRRCS